MTMITWSLLFKNGNSWNCCSIIWQSDYREITRTLLRNFLIAIVIATIIILFTPIIVSLTKNFFNIERNPRINKYLYICESIFYTC